MIKKVKKTVPDLRFPEFVKDWEISNIQNACEIKNNLRKPISLQQRALIQGLYPYYGPTGIIDYIDQYELDGKFALIGEDGDHFLKYKLWSQTQLVEGKFNANNHVHIITGTEKCLVEWFFVYFQHRNIFTFLTRQGAGRYKLNKASLCSLPIALPSIEEQEKIAKFLGECDRKLNLLRRKRELLETYKRGVMQKIFSQQIRFKNDDGSNFPDWEKKSFGEFTIKVKTKYNPLTDEEIYPCIELESIISNQGQLLQIFNSKEQQSIKNKFNSGDVLFGKLRPNLRKYIFTKFEGVCSSEIWVLRGKYILNKYLYYLIQTDKFYKISNVTFGSKMPRADWEFISSFIFKYPSLKEQEKIAEYLTAIDKKIEALGEQIEGMEKFKQGLLQKMFV